MRRDRLLAAVAVLSIYTFQVQATDCPAVAAFSVGGKKVFDVGGGLAFVSGIAVDLDGAPNAYHRLGREKGNALDTLCNAGRAWPGDGRKPYHGSAEGRCGEFQEDVAVAEASNWRGPTTIEWYGLATEDKRLRIPYVQQDGPTKGYYVSTTALADFENFPEKSDVRRYLDARVVPYFVVPKESRFIEKGESGLRDLVVSWNPRNEELSFGVVGDLGPAGELGEASAAFANALRKEKDRLPVDLMSYKTVGGLSISKPVLTVVFRGSRMVAPYTPDAVRSATKSRFEKWGGLERIKACARSLDMKDVK